MLAAGALVASILAFGAAPAAAGAQEADAQATWTACLGPAKADQGFTDVAMDSDHYDNINCLKYYGITTGKTDDNYDPASSVTRSQMALFLTRMADKAGVEFDDDSDAGFADLGDTGSDRVDAINRLANAGIMPGRSGAAFDPEGTVTRADMALHLFRFLDLALDSVLIDMLPDSVETNPPDGVGKIELNDNDGDGIGERVNDYFGDVRETLPAHMDDIIGAVYELGVTTGKNNMVGERGIFDPQGNVTRAQMASFIMRTLGHTNLRPTGLTAQQTRTQTQVSVRNADFEPVVNARVEVFRSNFARDAFDRSGRCIDRYVTDSDPSWDACRIDGGDARTDVGGNVESQPGSGGGRATIVCNAGTAYAGDGEVVRYRLEAASLVDDEAQYKLWAWTGSFGDTVDSDTDLFEAVPANQQDSRTAAVTAVFSGGPGAFSNGTRYIAKMGSAVVYEIQLVDSMGRPVGPNPTGNQAYTVTIQTRDADATAVTIKSVQTRTPNSDGNIRIVVTNPDSVIGIDNPDVEVSVMVVRSAGIGAGSANTLRFVDTTGAGDTGTAGFETDGVLLAEAAGAGTGPDGERRFIGAQAPVVTFSDDMSESFGYRTSFEAGRLLSSRNRNSLTLTALDQYGNTYRGGASYNVLSAVEDPDGSEGLLSKFQGSDVDGQSGSLTSDSSGRIYFNYNYHASVGVRETVTAGHGQLR